MQKMTKLKKKREEKKHLDQRIINVKQFLEISAAALKIKFTAYTNEYTKPN